MMGGRTTGQTLAPRRLSRRGLILILNNKDFFVRLLYGVREHGGHPSMINCAPTAPPSGFAVLWDLIDVIQARFTDYRTTHSLL